MPDSGTTSQGTRPATLAVFRNIQNAESQLRAARKIFAEEGTAKRVTVRDLLQEAQNSVTAALDQIRTV